MRRAETHIDDEAVRQVHVEGRFGETLRPAEPEPLGKPLLLFVILFGLSMDYHVFIVSRIRETFDRGAIMDDAIANGIKSTSGVRPTDGPFWPRRVGGEARTRARSAWSSLARPWWRRLAS